MVVVRCGMSSVVCENVKKNIKIVTYGLLHMSKRSLGRPESSRNDESVSSYLFKLVSYAQVKNEIFMGVPLPYGPYVNDGVIPSHLPGLPYPRSQGSTT